ncbi:pentulose/hexulose kinase [Saccharomonospora marina XMU15]|uniref:Pentulose/hexulose kinase n=1 Tax=Saccharomonospora marina XMU15 TaxID=882083 RepID=H5WZE9_9PSEU|nr:FGGY family carbohydrate kinase [Saccharomonospora marina]EHR49611.1 pentulose/hexulose kinase [Saccharomonospora marina XMU15]
MDERPEGPSRRAWLGIDVGTQSVRALVVGERGAVLGAGSAALTSRRGPDGRHEQDPESWWDALAVATREALGQAGSPALAAMACCATSGTVLLVEQDGDDPARPLTPGLMYDDGRAVAQARLVREQTVPAWQAAGLLPQRSWALPKAMWLLRSGTRPGARLAHQSDFITSRLIGTPSATDTSHALKTGVDPVRAQWPVDALAALGLAVERLPDVVRPGTLLGRVCPTAEERTGIPAGVPVVAGMTDGCAAQLAAGVLDPGRWSFVVGTTTVLKGVTETVLRDPTGVLYSHRSPDGYWWPGGASSTGAGLLTREFDSSAFARLERLAAEREPADCVTYPLTEVGERFPFHHPEASRVTLGTPRDDADWFAAILQGVAFAQRLSLDHVRGLGAEVSDEVTVAGGATRSAYWTQLQADILGRAVVVPRTAEGAVGMAVLAASATAGDLRSAAARMVGIARVHQPRQQNTRRFAEPYARLVTELAKRGWIGDELLATALAGTAS